MRSKPKGRFKIESKDRPLSLPVKVTGKLKKEYFKLLDPRMENIIEDKMSCDIYPIGSKAGGLTSAAAEMTGLKEGTAVAVANVDAHVAVPAATVTGTGQMVIIMGTSNCHMVCGTEEKLVPGICGYVEDGILPGLIGYEAGQSCVGDHFMWFVENCVPSNYQEAASAAKQSIHEYLTEKASQLKPGQSGLVALDWWNGNRSVLVDVDLTGLMVGMTLATQPEEMYRALLEATAYGTRMIIETFDTDISSTYDNAGGLNARDNADSAGLQTGPGGTFIGIIFELFPFLVPFFAIAVIRLKLMLKQPFNFMALFGGIKEMFLSIKNSFKTNIFSAILLFMEKSANFISL